MIDAVMVAIVIGGGPECWEAAHAASYHFDRVFVLAGGPNPAEESREAVSRRTRTWVRPNIEILENWTAGGLCVGRDGQVLGVAARRGPAMGEEDSGAPAESCDFLASLVIEASGEDSRLPAWLAAAGLAAPARTACSLAGFDGWQWHYDKIAMPAGLAVLGQAVRRFGDAGRDFAFALGGARLLGQCLADGTVRSFQRRLARLLKREDSVTRQPDWTIRVRATLRSNPVPAQ